MKRIIYSFYIDIPKSELDIFDKNILKEGQQPINYATKNAFKENYLKLISCKEWYAEELGVPFKLFEYDSDFIFYKDKLKGNYPYLTTYNIVNFYKIHLLYKLAQEYDEVLYLDFDVIPMLNENFFEVWDLSKGIAIKDNNSQVIMMDDVTEKSQTIRSPTAKYYNGQALLIDSGHRPKHKVVNTGIIGASKKHLDQLAYFDNFAADLQRMSDVREYHDMYPEKIRNFFGWDNETLWGVKQVENNVPVQWLNDKWHYHFHNQMFIPKEVVMCHTINKDFDTVWRRYYA
jgi:hypothetical protein